METARNEHDIFLSTAPATRRDQTAALLVVAVSAIAFALAVPFAKLPLAPVPAFIASYQSALALNDVITAILLFSQFALLRSRALLVLACGYLFTASATTVHTLVFPGLFTPTGLFGAGSQAAVWIYMIWHGGFPLFVLAYVELRGDKDGNRLSGSAARSILLGAAAVVASVAVLSWAAIAWEQHLPILIDQDLTTWNLTVVVAAICAVTCVALVSLWLQRPHSVLDLWLMVVLCAWLFDIGLSSLFNAGRFDLGYYAGRLYGLGATSFVLGMLLVDNIQLQAKLARLLGRLRLQAASERARFTEREHLLSAVVESSNDAIITQSLDGKITSWNRAAEHLFGHRAAEAIGGHIELIVPPDRRTEVDDMLARIVAGEKIQHHETVRIHRDGEQLDVSLSISPIVDAGGAIIGASKVARDITESKRTQRELSREIEERQRIFETSQDLILVTDQAGRLMQVSPSSLSILGYDPDEMIGRNSADFIRPADLDAARSEVHAARAGRQPHNFEAQFTHRDGRGVVLNWIATWSDPVQRYFFVGRDLTEKRAAEAQFRQAQKMEAIGQLTGGVAHDFNNILTVITGTVGILADAVAEQPHLASITTMIDESAERGAQLTRQLLAFARKQPLQPVDLDVNALVLDAAKLLRPTLGEHIEIVSVLPEDAWSALVDPNQLTSAVLNLALNARDAMPEGGKLTLETRNVALDDEYAQANSEVAAGDYVMVAVSDTGSGIHPDHLDKVFDPFFSTKGVGKGSGLGLSMVFGFVKQSGGHIKIYSEVDHGTSVKLYLPRSDAKPVAAAPPASREIQSGHESILVVEDDELVRKYVVTQIANLGYTTLSAANAAEALDIIDRGDEVDLLFTDVIMPGSMNGRQLADEALKHRPRLKVLFTSGYTENAVVHHGRLDAGVLLLAKPYRKGELARMIRVALER
ncbi:PAS domain S-box protein [Bradyrhizobium sp. HKCCYLS1011]|uniref:PAS domain S-box protein n=1 Tax=Bradyrhizobium sp. HKCCYLS1011 TaxID=3420733 RepID=UPI003EBB208F